MRFVSIYHFIPRPLGLSVTSVILMSASIPITSVVLRTKRNLKLPVPILDDEFFICDQFLTFILWPFAEVQPKHFMLLAYFLRFLINLEQFSLMCVFDCPEPSFFYACVIAFAWFSQPFLIRQWFDAKI